MAAYVTHRFAKHREAEKDRRDELRVWRNDATKLVDDVVDHALRHYYEPQSLASTAYSASDLTRKMKRLSIVMRKTECTEAGDMIEAAQLPVKLRDIVSLPADFDVPDRTIRIEEALSDALHECQDRFHRSIAAPRRFARR